MKGLVIQRYVTLALVSACVAAFSPALSAAETIRIGAILSLTGNTALQGQSMRDGLQLAADEINKRGGISGNKIELAVVDSRSDPKAAVEAFNAMELQRPPLFYVSFLSSVGIALGPLADQKKVVLVGLVTSALAFTIDREFVYRFWPLSQGDIPPIIRILRDLKVKKLGILNSNEEYGNEELKLLARAFSDIGGTVASQAFELTDTDYHRQIEALKDQDAIFVASLGASLSTVTTQIKAAHFGGQILMPSAGSSPAAFVAPEMQGVYVSAPIIYNPSYLYAREAGDKFTARYQKPINHWAAAGYDFINMVSGLLEDKPVSRQSVQDVFKAGFEYSGVFGPLRLRPGEHDMAFPMYPAQILNNTIKFR